MPTLAVSNFLGGWNARDDLFDVAPNQSPDLLNYRPAGYGGALRRRNGDRPINATGGGVAYLFPLRSKDSLIVASTLGPVYVVNLFTTTVATIGTFVPTSSSFWHWAFVEAPASGGQGPLYGIVPLAGAPPFQLVQGTGTAALAAWTASAGTIPLAVKFLLAGNRVWAFGDMNNASTPASRNSYSWSELGDPRNWPAANINQLDPADGDEFTAAAAIGPSIIAFKNRQAWQIYDLDTGANRPLAYGVGAATFAVSTSLGVVFDDPDQGLMVTDGSSIKPLSNGKVCGIASSAPSRAKNLTTNDGWTGAPVEFGGSIFFPARIGGLARVLEYDVELKAWFPHDGASLITAASVRSVSELLVAATLDVFGGTGAIFEYLAAGRTTYQDGSSLLPRYTSPWLTAGDAGRLKRFGPAIIQGAGPSPGGFPNAATIRHGFNAATWASRSPPFTGVATTERARVNNLGVSEALQLQFDGLTLLESLEVDYTVRGRR